MTTSPPTADAHLNEIVERQNGERGQRLLRARQQTYARATRLQITELVGVVLVPTVGAIVGLIYPELRAFIAAMSLLILAVDILVLDRWMRKLLKLSAQISEVFDCEVLQLPWNEFVAGTQPQAEDIHHAASRYPTDEKSASAIRDWYPVAVRRAPIRIARLACQRTNLWYDAKLRGRYSHLLVGIPVLVVLAAIVGGSYANLDFTGIVLTLLTPAAPVVVWSLRERNRQKDAADAQAATSASADALLAQVKADGCTEEECARRSREFQDAIFARRATNPLIFPLIYKLYRSQTEDEMNVGADERLKALGY